jgi:hypothetical protein
MIYSNSSSPDDVPPELSTWLSTQGGGAAGTGFCFAPLPGPFVGPLVSIAGLLFTADLLAFAAPIAGFGRACAPRVVFISPCAGFTLTLLPCSRGVDTLGLAGPSLFVVPFPLTGAEALARAANVDFVAAPSRGIMATLEADKDAMVCVGSGFLIVPLPRSARIRLDLKVLVSKDVGRSPISRRTQGCATNLVAMAIPFVALRLFEGRTSCFSISSNVDGVIWAGRLWGQISGF